MDTTRCCRIRWLRPAGHPDARMGVDVKIRYQFAIASVGEGLQDVRERLVKTIVNMGHMPIDLVAVDIIDSPDTETVSRHVQRSDYLVVVVGPNAEVGAGSIERIEHVVSLALGAGVPVIALLFGDASQTAGLEESSTGRLLSRLRESSGGLVRHVEIPLQTPQALHELLDGHERPGWVSAKEMPSADVASELVRLTKENAQLQQKVAALAEPAAVREARWEVVVRTMEENKLLIPVWNKAATVWEQPVEMTLYTFFIRMGPQLAGEISAADAVEFIPTGVCQLESRDARPSWVVPLHSLNLWLTDLMALKLIRPSRRKRQAKDQNQYWRLTREGRAFLSYVRRSALHSGGHRHVGFTKEYRISDLNLEDA